VDGDREKDMKKKITFLTLCAMLFALSVSTAAQQPTKAPRIGFLDNSTASGSAVLLEAFRQELSKLGWIEGNNITIEYRFAEQKNERLPELAAELVRLKVNLVVASSGPPALAAKKATTSIPIVMVSVGDPVAQDLVASLARPGGNVTGLSSLSSELIPKGWRYSRTRSPSSPELDFCGRREDQSANSKTSGLRRWH
jgi:putative tryptophan/tyrosine transport system substrate-binding protein